MGSVPVVVLAALATHVCFKTYEPKSPKIGALFLLLAPPAIHLLWPRCGFLADLCLFYATLVTSMTLYRVSPFHPLAHHPGPLLCRITKFRTVWEAIWGNTHRYYLKLHQQYGPVVRVGPNQLSIIEKDAIPAILGNHGMPKGPLWDGRRFGLLPDKDYDSLIDVRDHGIHASLRKHWNQAFGAGPVKDYHGLLYNRGEELFTQLSDIASKGTDSAPAITNIVQWVNFFSFDFMGDLAFGGSFNLMSQGDVHGAWKRMEDGVMLPSMTGHIPWIMPILKMLPLVTAKREEFKNFGISMAAKRMKMESKQNDLFYHLYELPAAKSGIPFEDQMSLVVSNSLLTIVAGSDTTSTTLSCTICCLLARPNVFARLRRELDEAFSEIDPTSAAGTLGLPEIEIDKLLRLPYLSAVVNEGLRLAPAVPTNIQRAPEKGSGGRILGDTNIFVPEGTSVDVPTYALHRDPRYFSPSPESFIPERWLGSANPSSSLHSDSTQSGISEPTAGGTSLDPLAPTGTTSANHVHVPGSEEASAGAKEAFTTNREAFIPFSFGPANCAGKPMAMLELRFVIAILVQRFDMCFKGFAEVTRNAAAPYVAQGSNGGTQGGLKIDKAREWDSKALLARERQWIEGLQDRFVFAKLPIEVEISLRRDRGSQAQV